MPAPPDRHGAWQRRVVVELPNRGNKRCLQFYNDAPATNDPRTLTHAGNGWLMRSGYAVMMVAWQGDVLPGDDRLVADLPDRDRT